MLDLQRRINFFVDDISRLIIMNDFRILQIPGFCFGTIEGAGCDLIRNDVVVRVLLEHLHVSERVAAQPKILNKPGARVGSIPENLSLNKGVRPATRWGEDCFAREFRVWRKRVVYRSE